MLTPTAMAGVTSTQIVQKSGGVVTWTGTTNSDAITVAQTAPSEVTIHSTTGDITIFDDSAGTGETVADCSHPGSDPPDATTVVCVNTSAFTANAGLGNDTVA